MDSEFNSLDELTGEKKNIVCGNIKRQYKRFEKEINDLHEQMKNISSNLKSKVDLQCYFFLNGLVSWFTREVMNIVLVFSWTFLKLFYNLSIILIDE